MSDIVISPARSLDMPAILEMERLAYTAEDPDFGTVLSPHSWTVENFTDHISQDGWVLYLATRSWDAGAFFFTQWADDELRCHKLTTHPHHSPHLYLDACLDYLLDRAKMKKARRLVVFTPEADGWRDQQQHLKRMHFKSKLAPSHYGRDLDAVEFFRTAPLPFSFPDPNQREIISK